MKFRWLVLAVALPLAVSGCVRTKTMDFAVPPPEVQANPVWARAVAVGVSVTDNRVDRTNVGKATAGDATNFVVRSTRALDLAVQEGIKAELQARGVRIADGPAFLLADISRADSFTTINPFDISVTADASLAVQVIGADGRVHYQRTYLRRESGKGEIWTMETAQQGAYRLQKVMAELIRELVDDDRLVQALVAANRGS